MVRRASACARGGIGDTFNKQCGSCEIKTSNIPFHDLDCVL